MSRVITIIIIVLQFCFGISSTVYTEENIRIGISLPLTGGSATFGTEISNSFLVAKELLKSKNVDFVFEDDQCDAKQGVTVANKLINFDKVNYISGILCNHVLIPASPVYNKASVPVFTIGGTSGDLKNIGKKIFRLYPADQLALEALLPYITERHTKLCMLTSLDAYTELMQRATKAFYQKLESSHKLIIEEVPATITDFKSILLRLSRNSCDAYFLNAPNDDLFILMYKHLKELNTTATIYASVSPGSSAVSKALGNFLNGTIYSDLPSYTDLATPLGQEFIKAYKKKFGDFQTTSPLGLMALEALRLILKAKELGVPVDQYVRNRKITDGAMLPYSFDADGAIEGIKFKLMQYKDGKTIHLK